MSIVRPRRFGRAIISAVLTVFGATAVTFMMVMYALERRHRGFVIAFACGCALSSAYGFLAGTWPFGVVEAIWAVIAVHRYRSDRWPASGGQRTRPLGVTGPRGRDGNHVDDVAGVAVHRAGREAEGAV